MDEVPSGDLWSLPTIRSEEEAGRLSTLTLIRCGTMDEIPSGNLQSYPTVRLVRESRVLNALPFWFLCALVGSEEIGIVDP
jgi:hypothetical protein